MKLYFDDIRYPPSPEWIWARTQEEAIKVLQHCDIDEASLDHDLGLHKYQPWEINWAELSDDWCDEDSDGVTLVEEMIELGLVPPKVTIHTWNPQCGEIMRELLEPLTEILIVEPSKDNLIDEEWIVYE